MNTAVEQRIRETMSAILGVPEGEIGPGTSAETVGSWDSVQHINLILALQEALGVQFEPAEISAMLSYSKIVQVVAQKAP